MEEFESRYLEVMVNPEHVAAARALKPIHERPMFGPQRPAVRSCGPRPTRCAWREYAGPSIADLFVAVMTNNANQPQPSLPTATVPQEELTK
jgi:ABC-2 type transport system ATP-binding protein